MSLDRTGNRRGRSTTAVERSTPTGKLHDIVGRTENRSDGVVADTDGGGVGPARAAGGVAETLKAGSRGKNGERENQ